MTNHATLAATLQAAAFGKVSEVVDGKVLITATGMGATATYALPIASQAQPQDVAAMLSKLLDRYDDAVAALPATPKDADILAQMLAQTKVIRSYGIDHSVPNFRP